MWKQPKVSVIIPVYNAGYRLRGCIDSLVGQTLKDIELIFIVDCPTDGSDAVVDEYAGRFDNIVVIKNEYNLNTGMSRNRGMEVARGEYVAFCDHDDIVKEYMYEDMYAFGVEHDADIVLGVPEYSYPDKSLNETFYYPQEGDVRETLLPLIIGRDDSKPEWKFYFSHGMIWDNIYRLDLIKKNNIQFIDNNKVTFEDNLFLIETLIHANKAMVYNKLVYVHTIEASNTAATAGFVRTDKIVNYVCYLDTLLNKYSLHRKYEENYVRSSCSYLKGCIRRESKQAGNRFKQTKRLLDWMKNNNILNTVFKTVSLNDFVYGSTTTKAKIIDVILYTYLKI